MKTIHGSVKNETFYEPVTILLKKGDSIQSCTFVKKHKIIAPEGHVSIIDCCFLGEE